MKHTFYTGDIICLKHAPEVTFRIISIKGNAVTCEDRNQVMHTLDQVIFQPSGHTEHFSWSRENYLGKNN